MDTARHRRKKKSKPRPLRGQGLVDAAKLELAHMVNLDPKICPINMSTLAERLEVSRQALYDNGLSDEVRKHAELQRQNSSSRNEAVVLRRPLEERIAELQNQNLDLEKKLDGWIEFRARVEYNAKVLGVDADKILAEIPPPLRAEARFKGSTKKRRGGN